MNNFKDPKSVCAQCNTEGEKKQLNAQYCDINTQSLLLMFRLSEVTMVECPKCGSKRMLV